MIILQIYEVRNTESSTLFISVKVQPAIHSTGRLEQDIRCSWTRYGHKCPHSPPDQLKTVSAHTNSATTWLSYFNDMSPRIVLNLTSRVGES